jgi:hypothetical protein
MRDFLMNKENALDALLSLLKDDAEYHLHYGTSYGRLLPKAKQDPLLQEKLRQIDRAIKELDDYVLKEKDQ